MTYENILEIVTFDAKITQIVGSWDSARRDPQTRETEESASHHILLKSQMNKNQIFLQEFYSTVSIDIIPEQHF